MDERSSTYACGLHSGGSPTVAHAVVAHLEHLARPSPPNRQWWSGPVKHRETSAVALHYRLPLPDTDTTGIARLACHNLGDGPGLGCHWPVTPLSATTTCSSFHHPLATNARCTTACPQQTPSRSRIRSLPPKRSCSLLPRASSPAHGNQSSVRIRRHLPNHHELSLAPEFRTLSPSIPTTVCTVTTPLRCWNSRGSTRPEPRHRIPLCSRHNLSTQTTAG